MTLQLRQRDAALAGFALTPGGQYAGQLNVPGSTFVKSVGLWVMKTPTVDLDLARVRAIAKISEAITREGQSLTKHVALTPVVVTAAFVAPPTRIMPASIIPPIVEDRTLAMVSEERQTGEGQAWSTSPPALHRLAPVVGALMAYAGKRLLLAVALEGAGLGAEWLGSLRKTIQQRGVTLRIHTGRTKVGTQTGDDDVWTAQPYPTPQGTGDSYLDALGRGFDNLYGVPK